MNTVTTGATAGAAAFLSRICLPAAEEFGLLLRDRVGAWRARNLERIAEKAEAKLNERGEDAAEAHAHPRVAAHIIDFGSWSEDDLVQELWSGLLASSCTPDGDDDSNLMFVDFLNRLSLSQVKLLDRVCRSTPKAVRGGGWVVPADRFRMTIDELRNVSGLTDLHRLDRELDHLRSLGLLTDSSGFDASGRPGASDDAEVTPMPLALQMWARCQGWIGDPREFYNLPMTEAAETPRPAEATPT